MKYILFVGSRIGYESLIVLTELNCDIGHVFIEKEHEHEYEKYYDKSINHCELNKVPHNINASNQLIHKIIEGIDSFDYILSFGYRRMISDSVTNKAIVAALGTHFSPLPRYRGFAPLNWVLINGEEETAVNLFYLDKKVDNGDIIARKKVKIDYENDVNSLFEKCVVSFKEMMKEVIPKLETGDYEIEKQDESKATYTCSRNPEDGIIDWNWESRRIYNFVRALTYPFPGAFTYSNGKKVSVWSCEEYNIPKYEGIVPGKVIKVIRDKGVVVLCGQGAILIKEIEVENRGKVLADKYIKSVRVTLHHKIRST